MHLPKCGGTTLHQLIDDDVSYRQVYLPVAKDPQPKSVTREWKGRGEDVRARLCDWLSQYDRMHTHTNFLGVLDSRWKSFTFLREPVDRLVSLYNHWQTFTDYELETAARRAPRSQRKQNLKVAARDMSLREFLQQHESDTTGAVGYLFNNGTANLLAADRPGKGRKWVRGLTPAELEAEAMGVLERLDVVGVLEQMDESLALIFDRMDLRPRRQIARKNAREYDRLAVIAGAEDLVESMTCVDARLYSWARERLSAEFARLLASSGGSVENVYRELDSRYLARRHEEAARLKTAGALPDKLFIGMQDGLRGDGWHEREGVKLRLPYRWTGPGADTSLDVMVRPARRYRVRFEYLQSMHPDVLAGATLSVNGEVVPVRVRRRWWGAPAAEAVVPADESGDGLLRVTLHLGRTASERELGKTQGSSRPQGLLVTGVQILPA